MLVASRPRAGRRSGFVGQCAVPVRFAGAPAVTAMATATTVSTVATVATVAEQMHGDEGSHEEDKDPVLQ